MRTTTLILLSYFIWVPSASWLLHVTTCAGWTHHVLTQQSCTQGVRWLQPTGLPKEHPFFLCQSPVQPVILPLGNIHTTGLLNRGHRQSLSLFLDANALRCLCSSCFVPWSLLWDTHLSKIKAVLKDLKMSWLQARWKHLISFYTPSETSRPTLGHADKPQLQLKSKRFKEQIYLFWIRRQYARLSKISKLSMQT